MNRKSEKLADQWFSFTLFIKRVELLNFKEIQLVSVREVPRSRVNGLIVALKTLIGKRNAQFVQSLATVE